MTTRRRTRIVRSCAVVLCIALSSLSAHAQISGSAHDFSGKGWADAQICKPCHTPHNALRVEVNGYLAGRLWNHSLSASSQVYSTLAGDLTRDDALDVYSLLCMGCHDGTVALDSYGGRAGSMFVGINNVAAPDPIGGLIGIDLTDDHPVGAGGVWPDPEVTYLRPRSTWENQTFGGSRMGGLRPMSINGEERLVVSCATCHEPHGRGNYQGMLRIDNAGSQMCLVCHVK